MSVSPAFGQAVEELLVTAIEPLFHGRGLGRWLVNWIVYFSEGTVSADSDGDGSIVTMSLPTAS